MPPQRRRTIILGAGPTGISAAFHLGEHSLLLERRTTLEEAYDHSHDLPMGAARRGYLGLEDPGAGAERKALYSACSSAGEASSDEDRLIHVARWQPPEFADTDQCKVSSLRGLIPLLRGEVRLGANVVRISPSLHMLELADGSRFVYDKLLSTLPLMTLATLVWQELASRKSHAEFFSFWLGKCDIELADRTTQSCQGDVDEISAGKRMAQHIHRALAGRFQARGRGSSFAEPRLVQAPAVSSL